MCGKIDSNIFTNKLKTRKHDTFQIMRVSVSDTCHVIYRHDTDTYNYNELCDFLKLLVVLECKCLCRVRISTS